MDHACPDLRDTWAATEHSLYSPQVCAPLPSHGERFVEADIARRKIIFGEHLLRRVPLAAHILHVLDERSRGRAPLARFLRELADSLTEDEAGRILDVVVDWGRYAEIFEYDDVAGTISKA